MRDVVILGSTGSIGTQALEVVAANPDRFRVVGLAAGGSQIELLARQALDFDVAAVAISDEDAFDALDAALQAEANQRGLGGPWPYLPGVLVGPDAATDLVGLPCDVVLNGITGSAGLAPTLAALAGGTILALANKESLVIGGPLVTGAAEPGQIVAVDSEHSALAQALRGGSAAEVDRLVLTASGGPFRGRSREQMRDVTPEQALAHPTWDMGRVITTNSATLVNKGLELLEAHLLYGVDLDRIDVVVHPQSIVHSMVQFVDGSTLAQCSPPDMKLPIALGLGWPDRVPGRPDPATGPRPPAGPSNRWTTRPFRRSSWPGGPGGCAAPRRRCSTPPTRSASTRSTRASCPSSRSSRWSKPSSTSTWRLPAPSIWRRRPTYARSGVRRRAHPGGRAGGGRLGPAAGPPGGHRDRGEGAGA